MRKGLIGTLLALLILLSAYLMVKGVEIFSIPGFYGISQKNDEVDKKISDLAGLVSVTYPNTIANLKRAENGLIDAKTEYENQAILASSSTNPSYALKTEKYEIDYLWTKLGNHAKDNGVIIKIELTANSANASYYDLNFTCTGTYVGITDFIYAIENDSNLGFKIEDFGMNTISEILTANFKCKDIAINVGRIDSAASESSENNDKTEDVNRKDTKVESPNEKGNVPTSKEFNN